MLSSRALKTRPVQKKDENNQKPARFAMLTPLIRGMLIGMIFTILAILLFALLLKVGIITEGAISLVNQVIKILGIVIASFFCIRRATSKTWLWGGIAGVAYILFGFLLFGLIEGSFNPTRMLLADMGMGFLVGMLFSLIFGRGNNKTKKA